jgi:hypothetical protein
MRVCGHVRVREIVCVCVFAGGVCVSSVLFFGCARQRAGGGEVEEGERGARARGALTAAPSFDPARAANTARSAIRMYLPIVLVRGVISKNTP